MISYDDEQEADQEEGDGSDWVPPPPPDDDDYEDPNPRAPVVDDEPKPVPRRPVSAKQANDEAAAEHIAEAIKRVGLKGALGELLEVVAREQKPEEQKTCPVCGEETVMLHSAMVGGSMKARAECGSCQGKRNRHKIERVEHLVKELKKMSEDGDPDPSREREIMAQLREYDHPDVDGLVRWCKQAADRASRKPKKNSYGY